MSQLTLKQFILRSEVLQLYRDMLRVVRRLDNPEYQKQMKDWIRTDFQNNKHHTEEDVIRMMITKGKLSLREIEQAVQMAK